MADLAGLAMLHGAPLREEDLGIGLRLRDALAGGGAQTVGLRRARGALLIGTVGHGRGAPAASPPVAVVLAGRIDNAAALRATLEGAVAGQPAQDDAALVAVAYQAWGAAFAERLEGAFAFALHDAATGLLLCGRDRFGLQPFHYVLTDTCLAFASDLPILLRWRSVRRAVDHDVLAHYLTFGFCPIDRAPFRDVRRLRPGHLLFAERLRTPRLERYWAAPPAEAVDAARARDTVAARTAQLDAAARRALDDASGPIGILLPGDPVSALLGASLGRLAARRGAPVHAFALAAPGRRGACDGASAVHRHAVPLDAASAAASLGLIPRRGEPFADPRAFALQALLAAAEARVPACVTAAGGAEMLLARPRYTALAAALRRHRDGRIPASARQGFHATMPFVRDLYADLGHGSSDADRLAMAGPALIGSLLFSPADEIGPSLERADEDTVQDLAARVDLTHGAPRTLAALDVARYGRGPALSAPLLHTAFASWALALPQAERLALSAGAAGPSPPPLDDWLRSSLRELLADTLASAAFRSRELFRLPWVDRVLREHLAGTRSNGVLLWALLSLETWFATVVEAGEATTQAPASTQADAAVLAEAVA